LSFGKAYKLAVVLTKSQLRGYQRRRLGARLFGDPRIILAADAAVFAVPALLGYVFLSRGLPTAIESAVGQIEAESLAGMPTAMAFMLILFGILGEISQPIQSSSTDLINWLPISPGEYVAGSTMSLSYTYSFMLALLIGATLGPAIVLNTFPTWVVAAAMTLLSLFMGACVVELLRALTNRISSSFYKRSGRSGIFVRLLLTILVLVLFQLLFSGNIIIYLLQGLMLTVRAAWFVPVVWPSLAVLSVSQGDTIAVSAFALLTLVFVVALFGFAVKARAVYWVPVPVSIRLTNQTYHPSAEAKKFLGLSVAESAIFRKDLRSLTRRREMARLLAIPFVLAVSLGISLFPIRGSAMPVRAGFYALIPVYVMPVAIFCAIMSMTSIGQEGNAVWNLYVAPITPRQLLKVKLVEPVLLGLAFSAAMLVFLGFLLNITLANFAILLSLSAIIVVNESALGMFFAAKFADFRDIIRSRFVSAWGSLFGTLVSLILAGITVSPIVISIIINGSIGSEYVVLSWAVGLIIFLVSWRLAEQQMSKLLREILV
jgi:hypothetical protein